MLRRKKARRLRVLESRRAEEIALDSARSGAPISPDATERQSAPTELTVAGDRKFESCSLQRRVCCELDSLDLDEFRSAHGWPGSAMAIALRAALSLWPWMGHCPLGSCRARKALLSAPPVCAARPSATANRHRASAPARCGLRPKSRCG